MGEILRDNYENSKRPSPHHWKITYNGRLYRVYDDYQKMVREYQNWRRVLKPDERALLTYDIVFDEPVRVLDVSNISGDVDLQLVTGLEGLSFELAYVDKELGHGS